MPLPPLNPDAAARTRELSEVRVEDLHKSFGRQQVLRGVNLAFPPGKTTVILGPSGCGKSVLLKHLVGLLKPDRGRVWFGSTRIDTLSEPALVPIRRRFGFLFQQGALFDSMSVRQNILFPLREAGFPIDDSANQRVERVLGMVGLSEAIDKYPAELSGGMQKRAALARARPKRVSPIVKMCSMPSSRK